MRGKSISSGCVLFPEICEWLEKEKRSSRQKGEKKKKKKSRVRRWRRRRGVKERGEGGEGEEGGKKGEGGVEGRGDGPSHSANSPSCVMNAMRSGVMSAGAIDKQSHSRNLKGSKGRRDGCTGIGRMKGWMHRHAG